MNDYPLVSVVLATYNWKPKRISESIESVIKQTYPNIEFIIINDASTNDIEKVILEYKNKNANIIYLRNDKNYERSYSRNRWIFESSWKYIAFIDDDDIRFDKDKLKKQIEFLESNNDYVLCWTCGIAIDKRWKELAELNMFLVDKKIRDKLLLANQFLLASVVVKKDVLLSSWLFRTEFNKVEDYDLWLRIGQYWKIGNLKDKSIYYRTWLGNTTTTSWMYMKKLALKSMCLNRRWYYWFLWAFIKRIFWLLVPYRRKFMLYKYLHKENKLISNL